MSDELAYTLLHEEAVAEHAVAEALFASVTTGAPLVHALVETGAITNATLSRYLARGAAPELLRVHPATDLIDRLPAGLPARLFAIPVRRDAITGTVDVAVADTTDPHPGNEIAFHLSAPVRLVRAPLDAIEDALSHMRSHGQTLASHDAHTKPLEPLEREHERLHDETRRHRIDTPSWGTPVHSANIQANPSEAQRDLESEIPIPLTRRTSAGGTGQAPLPLDEGYAVDPSAVRAVVEIHTERDRKGSERLPDPNAWLIARIPPPPPMPSNTGAYKTYVAAPERTRRASQSDEHRAATRSDVITMLRSATSRHAIFDLVLEGARSLSPRAAIFIARRGGFRGWSCTPQFGDRSALAELFVDAGAPSIFDEAARTGFYVGPVQDDEVHAPLLDVMGGSSRDVTVVAVRIRGRAAVMIVTDAGNAKVAAHRLGELAQAAGHALSRVLHR
ncbi:MAG: hypothetical protein FWD69_05155 [Polyangiaceae bacterium]|nr:hypothetical protein [Polyangiaceae bacterium]